jgi:hypothetical protein
MKATKEQIETVLANVREERKVLPEYSSIGENNWEALDESIRLLENTLDGKFPQEDFDSIAYECNEWLIDTKFSDFGTDYGA